MRRRHLAFTILFFVAAPSIAMVPLPLSDDLRSSGFAGEAAHADGPAAPVSSLAAPAVAGESVSSAPPAPAVRTAPAPVSRSAGTGESASDQAARVSREAMIPHPHPPAETNIAPGIQALQSAANASTINLGTLNPTSTVRSSR